MRRFWPIIIACAAVALATGLPTGAAQAQSAPPVQYVVKPGDTLYRIAARHNVLLSQLAAANHIYNVNRVSVGQVLTIPGDHPPIIFSVPAWNADASSPLTVSGQSDTFEGTVLLRVYDSSYRMVGTGRATGGGYGTYGSFSANITYTVRVAQTGIVEAYYASPKDGSAMGQVDVRVRLTTVIPGPPPPPPPRVHVVQRGDTLYRLALRYKTTVHAIAEANHLSNNNLIYVGQRLVIP